MPSEEATSEWALHGRTQKGDAIWRTAVRPLPFQIGRSSQCHLRLRSPEVSQRHAELLRRGTEIWLRDLGSTNGTFVNGRTLSHEHKLRDGDIIHFADLEFRVTAPFTVIETEIIVPATMQIAHTHASAEPRPIREVREFLGSIEEQDVHVVFQAIVELEKDTIIGYEALGRNKRPDLPRSPGELFQIAERMGLTRELCNAFRRKALALSAELPTLPSGARPELFINSHPQEIIDSEVLLQDLRQFRRDNPNERLVLEIHETAITDTMTLGYLRDQLEKLGIIHAFDDFGSGEARLKELCESAPHLVKFDAHFARDLPASPQRLEVVKTLVNLMKSLEIETLIEGVETEEEVEACRRLGFDYAQGFYFARPTALEDL